MISRKLSILLVLVILSSFAQAKDECPRKCVCSEEFSVVKCWELEKFPVFPFASKVKILDLSHGKIKTIRENDVKAYKNLEKLFISNNPLDCDHATTHTFKYFLRESAKLKSFDGHKIKCQQTMPKFDSHYAMAAGGLVHHGIAWAWPSVHYHGVYGGSPTPGMVAGVVCLIMLGLFAVAGLCCFVVRHKRRSCSDGEDPMSKMEEGIEETDTDTAHALMEGLKKQRRSSQGFPQNAIVDSADEDVVEEEEYLREKMKKQRRLSQGYADGSGSSDEESTMVEINLNEDLYSPGN